MIEVKEAEQIILQQRRDYGTESIAFDSALGYTLAEEIKADRDLPPYDRVTMDGIAISYTAFEKGTRAFSIKATIAAGDAPIDIDNEYQCIELMTGCALPGTTDTVIRYEDLEINNGFVLVKAESIRQGQNIHRKGKDKKQGDIVVSSRRLIDPAIISMAASVGKSSMLVKKLPRVVIITTGDELVNIDEQPSPFQVRKSNNYTIKAILQQHYIAADMLHIPDNETAIKTKIADCLSRYDVILLTGGISMGKFDLIPQALEELCVTQLFHKVAQRPGKPFWFGTHPTGPVVFAFPGNPVSAFMCMHRYFIPWLYASIGIVATPQYSILEREVVFEAPLQYFMQVRISGNRYGQLMATPIEGNGSGDFSNLLQSNAFMELPMDQTNFMRGEVYRIWPFKPII